MPVVVYDLERGPTAAEAVDAVLDPEFAQQLALALHVTNVDRLPPAALMAEWAVRCVYTDGVTGWAPAEHDVALGADAWPLVDAALQGVHSAATVARFLHATLQYVTWGRRVGRGLWPDVDVQLARCTHQRRLMRLALLPVSTDDKDGDAHAASRHQGRELLAQARVVLGDTARRSTINCTG